MKKGVSFRSRHTVRIAGLVTGLLILMLTPLGGGKPAHAAPTEGGGGGSGAVQWVNRGTVKYSDHYYVDSNPGDDTPDFTTTLTDVGNCTATVRFDMNIVQGDADGQQVYFPSYVKNDKFYYGDSTKASNPTIIMPTGKKDPGGNFICDDVSTYASTAINVDYRKIAFVKTADGKKIKNYKNTMVFAQVASIPNLYRREDEAEPCKDMIFLGAATSDDQNGDGAQLFAKNQAVAGSSVLYGVSNNADAGRWAETYKNVFDNNKTCAIDNGDLYNSGTFSAAGNEDGSDYDKIEDFIAKGIAVNGSAFMDGDGRDDAFVVFVGTEAANSQLDANGNPLDPAALAPTINRQTCKGGALGWIVCPIMSAVQAISDAIKDAVAAMLKVNPLPLDSTSTVYKVWENFRNFSNIMFVIVFMIIIFSQATSIGLSSYGIKSMLPRLIAIAIISNISYYICSIAIDLFNVLGAGIENLFAIANGGSAGTVTIGNLTGVLAIGTIGTVIGVSIATSAIVELFPLIIGALMAIVAVFIVLVIRQALLIMLVVASPLILVLGILPGTRQYASNLTTMFITLLVMYPLIIGLFSAARIASSILTALGNP